MSMRVWRYPTKPEMLASLKDPNVAMCREQTRWINARLAAMNRTGAEEDIVCQPIHGCNVGHADVAGFYNNPQAADRRVIKCQGV